MKSALSVIFVLCLVFLSSSIVAQETNEAGTASTAAAGTTITTQEARQNIGKTVTICGTVAEARYLSDFQSKLTFLNMDAPHPDQTMDVVIEDADRAKFTEPPEIFYKGKKICITGLIEDFKSRPQIKVKDPSQITVVTETP